MNPLFVILTIIIILAIFYLVYRNNQYNKILESFDNSTQNSLSTFYHNTVDRNTFDNKKHIYNGLNMSNHNLKLPIVDWNGIWESADNKLNSQIINFNDKILIALSNTDLQKILQNIDNNISSATCPPNAFIGIGILNKDNTIFRLNKIICNNLKNSNLNIQENKFVGKIDSTNTSCTLYLDDLATQIDLKKKYSLNSDKPNFVHKNLFIQKIAPYLVNYPIMPSSTLSSSSYYCTDSSPCKVNNMGLGQAFDNLDINACGIPSTSDDNVCKDTPKCIWYSPAPSGYKTCEFTKTAFDYSNFAGINAMYNLNNNNLEICDQIKFFGKNGFNSAILCYVSNFKQVQTLNYEFFGALQNESNLTMQEDIMSEILNIPTGLLPKYRTAIRDKEGNPRKAISFTNCFELNNNIDQLKRIVSKCKNDLKNMASNFKPSNYNNKLYPAVWTINKNNTSNILNSCPITLSTSSLYNVPVKYIESQVNGNIGLSLYQGGNNQNLYLVNSNIIRSREKDVIMTCNIKNNEGLYLLPSSEKSGFSNNSGFINLKKEPEMNGKWVIIGFNLNNIDKLKRILLSDTFSFSNDRRNIPPTWAYPTTIKNWYTPAVNNLVGSWSLTGITNSAIMTVSFWINITTINSNWRNIFHVSNTNRDCCNPGDRVPAVWISPNNASLYIKASSQNNGDDGLTVSAQLPLNTPIFITIVFNKNTVKTYFSGISVGTYNFPTNIVSANSAAKFYIADPWYPSNQTGFSIKTFELYNKALDDTKVLDLYKEVQNIETQEDDPDIN